MRKLEEMIIDHVMDNAEKVLFEIIDSVETKDFVQSLKHYYSMKADDIPNGRWVKGFILNLDQRNFVKFEEDFINENSEEMSSGFDVLVMGK